ncbi:argininosuccinate synthase [Listeria welshimeri]|uniref:Argininosuccinate synthase n=1 Tax=Listeria welshimeri serovar 6b (strain ATCC 35897 / DSM 20650 / CCUG 15529 / CIP 8149 / NCTC 11857 / SLCC 5334 / V8) TaxID=386043 RepID=ASSY_LISW6|nr:argininosuccinate synthase [Listeria welshimeri]A0AKJ7.1 RecName: Full=Argininosuccinate synthase; AltName: Full=Citrulline--aspartate ligase [Listeria welshimeri serovar 6b str. SLCC5334]MBC1364101.1 argininosuccinate synthase [Listeria welshimeri]MBC1432809.1 argininosuccinate synthase [Listeria welshimeri]MBC1518226.1 argininosuccinate synthase [Listeria welshimeri]MBC1638828.1 argininosuccinate synthase [Listeria welshimeri]MBC1671432.1 argininosuccinate synthase [Listeria welshimeri]
MTKEKIVLAYSGGLDTSVAIQWLVESGYEVIACCLDVGEGKNLDFIKEKAITVGASESYTIDAKEEFAEDFALIALQAHAYYEGKYPLISALSRPLIAKKLVEVARQEGASAIAHGCTGKGNDQVRFEVAIHALAPDLKVISPVRDWKWSREEEINYAKEHNIPVPIDLDNPFSIDQNLWGRSNECGVLENPWTTPPEAAYDLTVSLEDAPDTADIVEITFDAGIPISLNGENMSLANLILTLNEIAGKHGVGRIDHIENRLVGIKSREVYECPAAVTLIKAHKELEDLTFVREVAHFKPIIEQKISETIYNGLWFSPLTEALVAFLKSTQKFVNGTIRVKLFKGHAIVEGRKSPNSLYDENLATYTSSDTFDQDAAVGFIKLWGLPTKVSAEVNSKVTITTEV